MKVAIYCRVSTEDQAGAKTIANQVDFARRYCDLQGLEIHDFYLDDGVSGTVALEDRPAGAKMMEDARRGMFGAVYVYRLDRLARTTLEILRTHEKLSGMNIILKSMTESFDTSTPSGKFFMTTLGGIAEIERATIAERMRVGKNRALREGRWPGGPPPYGYSLEQKRLVINEKEAEVVKLIYDLYCGQGMDTVTIADYLTARGFPTPASARRKGGYTGNKWHGNKVWGILTSSTYQGVYVYGKRGQSGQRVKMACPAIISPEIWEKAQKILKKNYFNARRNAKREYLLRGLVRCGVCGRSYCGDGSDRQGRKHYYRCTGNSSFRGKLVPRCGAGSVPAEVLEQIVWDDIVKYLRGQDPVLDRLRLMLPQSNQDPGQGREITQIETELRSKEEGKARVLGLYRRGIIDHAEAENELTNIAREISSLQNRKEALVSELLECCSMRHRDTDRQTIEKLLVQKLKEATISVRRDLVQTLVDTVVVDTVAEGGRKRIRVTIYYFFKPAADCALYVETRGKYRLGLPKSPY